MLHVPTRQRAVILRSPARLVQHMQKTLTSMGIQLAQLISDMTGKTGQKIRRSIAGGERDGRKLAASKCSRIDVSLKGS